MDCETYKNILYNSPTGFAFHRVIYDEEGIVNDYEFLEVNKAFERLTGLREEAVVGRRATEVLPNIKKTATDWVAFFGDLALHGGRREFSFFAQTLNIWFRITAYSPQKDFFITHVNDITKEVQHIRELDRIFKVTPDLIGVLDCKGQIIKVNRAWENILGYDNVELIGYDLLDFVCPLERAKVETHLQYLSAGNKKAEFIARFRNSNGNYLNLDCRCHVHGPRIYLAARDISDKVEEQRIRDILVEGSNEFLQMTAAAVDYQKITSYLGEISGAQFINFTVFNTKTSRYETVALYGVDGIVEEITAVLGYEPLTHRWHHGRELLKDMDGETVMVFSDGKALWNKVLSEDIIDELMAKYPTGEAVLVKILREGMTVGSFALAMPAGKKFTSHPGVEIFARQVGMLLARIEAENEVSNQKAHFEALFLSTNDAMIYFDENGEVFKINDQFTELFGYTIEDLRGRNVNIVFQVDGPVGERAADQIIKGKKLDIETIRLTKSGEQVPVHIKGGPVYIDGEIKGGYAIYDDISERVAYEKHLKHLSIYDQLTGLYNRNFFDKEIKVVERSDKYPITILAFDVDGLKLVNDTLGHDQGDALLRIVADILSQSLRDTDILARVGGDEFVAVLPITDYKTGKKVAQRIRENIAKANQEKRSFLISVSMGVATSLDREEPLADTLIKADEKMYHEKLVEKKSYRGEMIATLLDTMAELKEPESM